MKAAEKSGQGKGGEVWRTSQRQQQATHLTADLWRPAYHAYVDTPG